MSVPAAVPAIFRPRRPDIDRFLLLLQKEKNETRRTVSSCKDYAAAAAAVDYGADAVYIGGRAVRRAGRAAGNSAEEIARVVEYAHRFGVRVHATLNTLVWDDELEAAERQAAA